MTGTARDEPELRLPFPDAFAVDPSPTWAELRRDAPVRRVRTVAGDEVWLVTRYDDVRVVLADARFSRALVVRPGAPRTAVAAPRAGSITAADPPEHTRLRRLVAGSFTQRRMREFQPWIGALTHRLADDVAAVEGPVDLRRLFALPLPITVICHLLGVPAEDQPLFARWSEVVYSMDMAEKDEVERSYDALDAYVTALVAERRSALLAGRAPSGALLDELVLARDQQDRLSEAELVSLVLTLLVAGHETTANQIGSFLITLLRDPTRWERLVAEPDLIPDAVEELLRFNRLGETGQYRVAAEDVVVAGVRIRAGDGVIAAIGSANRDEAVFDSPDSLDFGRGGGNPHLAFGHGIHHCLGAALARVELREALRTLTTRFPRLRLAVPVGELRWRRVLISGVAELPVRTGPPTPPPAITAR
ncbi:cytochrome P450 [Actinoalloteichus caeruleus]|uniref:Cytochrome P450 n=1 Tax=Actinoalloteichus caeruleus DSM 43889 TaxID=1120930 RepID=A0ABT1JP47_ACTCY|nr:cytochrome P450 [Actinoalloteichus caeruleus]MCP2333944.1 Cytochrome P450 [Actinoalloteichus caeruleus DSM 43889]